MIKPLLAVLALITLPALTVHATTLAVAPVGVVIANVPDSSSSLGLLGLGIVALIALRKKILR